VPSNHIESDKIFIKDALDWWYRVPDYQRPYVWELDQVSDLLDDVAVAANTKPDAEYFLGSIVLQQRDVRGPNGDKYQENDLLDGQQRLTTCLMMHAVARDLTEDKNLKESCQKAIYQRANDFDGVPERFRIAFDIRESVRDFAKKFLETEDGTSDTKTLAEACKSKDLSVRNMANAINHIREYFKSAEFIGLNAFFRFFRNKVLLIYVASTELDDAFKLFTVLNDRGVRLRGSDILKTMNLRALKSSGGTERDEKQAALMWEEIEGELGEDFDVFLSQIRTVLVKEKARLSLLQEFEDNIYAPREFIKETKQYKKLEPLLRMGKDTFDFVKRYREHYAQVLSSNNHAISNSWEFDNLIRLLNDTGLADFWLPPLLYYRDVFGEERILEFLRKLENKFLGDWIARETPTDRIEAMNAILKNIAEINLSKNSSSQKIDTLLQSKVFDFNKVAFFRELDAGVVYGRRYARYILYKLDMIYGGPHVRLQPPKNMSVEHVLPQNPEDASQWCKDFTSEQREEWTDRLGNLVLISRSKNASQGRIDYKDKVERYFKNSIEPFPKLRVLQRSTWALADLKDNQTQVIQKLREYVG